MLPSSTVEATASSTSQAMSDVFPEVPLGNTHGILLIGTFCGVILFGLSVHQAYKYAHSFSSDTLLIKGLVISVMLLETFHVAITVHTSYYYLVSNYFNPVVLARGVWSLDILPFVSGVLMFISQFFFVCRVFMIGPIEQIVAGTTLLLLMGEVGCSIAATVKALTIDSYRETRSVTYLSAIGLGLAVLGDSSLTLALVMAFRRSRRGRIRYRRGASLPDVLGHGTLTDVDAKSSPTVYDGIISGPRAGSVADQVQLYAINTGLLTGLFNILAFATGLAYPATFVCASLNIITTRLYGNSLLAVLNSRQTSLAGMEIFVDNSSPINIADAQRAQTRMNWNLPLSPQVPQCIRVAVTTETEEPQDGSDLFKRLTGSLHRKATRGKSTGAV